MGQDPSKVAHQYDIIAEEYAKAFSGEHERKPKDQEMLLRFSQEIGGRSPVWDFGCGPGQTSAYLKDLGVDISGLDLSERILEQARAIRPDIPFHTGNILDLEFDDDTIAGVVAFYAIVHFTKEQVDTAFREIYRVLRPGGLFLLTFHIGGEQIRIHEFLGKKLDIDFMFFTSDFISRCLSNSGFEKIEIIEREPYPGVEYESRRAYAFAVKPTIRRVR